MKTLFAASVLALCLASGVRAQEPVPNKVESGRNEATAFSTTSAETAPLPTWSASTPSSPPRVWFRAISSSDGSAPEASPVPDPSPAPDPKFLYGGRDDFRWQLAIGVDWIRFRSSIFNASAVGMKSSVTYFTNEWFGVEGNVSAAFAPTVFGNDHVKLLVYGAGPKIAWRQKRWEPWMHAIFGGSHEQPQTADNSRNAFAVELGGGADYRFNPRFSGRLEANWVHTSFFSQSQNNFELMGGVVFHF